MNFFNKHKTPEFEILESIEFKNKTFHLLANFASVKNKSEFSKKINELGGECRGFGETKQLWDPSTTDYFIIGDKLYREGQGEKINKIHRHNQQNPLKPVPIITESHCLEHINKIPPKPQM